MNWIQEDFGQSAQVEDGRRCRTRKSRKRLSVASYPASHFREPRAEPVRSIRKIAGRVPRKSVPNNITAERQVLPSAEGLSSVRHAAFGRTGLKSPTRGIKSCSYRLRVEFGNRSHPGPTSFAVDVRPRLFVRCECAARPSPLPPVSPASSSHASTAQMDLSLRPRHPPHALCGSD